MADMIQAILSKIEFNKRRVLCLGCGRNAEAQYIAEREAAVCVEAVISKDAKRPLAKTPEDGDALSEMRPGQQDAFTYLQETRSAVSSGRMLPFDVVLILDSIELLPQRKADDFFAGLKDVMSQTGLLVINAPAYRNNQNDENFGVGQDVLQGIEGESNAGSETSGDAFHYSSTVALQAQLFEHGFCAITEAHFFSLRSAVEDTFYKISYYQRWENEKARGVALAGTYEDDAVEYLLIDAPPIEKVTFREGVLSGITLLTTPEYCDLAYKDGNIDVEAMLDLQEIVAHKDYAVVFDVGGFVGANALVYAKLAGKNGRVVVFEPNPYNRNRIFRNLSYNPELQARVWVEPFALSDEKGTCEMVLSSNIDSGYSSTSRISHAHAKIADAKLPDGFVKHLVSVTTLDDYVKEAHVVPDIVKVDVEGAEYMLLQGAQNLLRETRPVFYVEYHSEYCATMCTQLLYLNGYVVYPCKEEEDNRLIIKAQFAAETSGRGDGSDSGAKWNEAAQLEHAAGRALERKEAERLAALCEDLTREKERALEQAGQLQREIHRLTDELDQVRNSTSWKITALPRKMMDSMKKIIRKR